MAPPSAGPLRSRRILLGDWRPRRSLRRLACPVNRRETGHQAARHGSDERRDGTALQGQYAAALREYCSRSGEAAPSSAFQPSSSDIGRHGKAWARWRWTPCTRRRLWRPCSKCCPWTTEPASRPWPPSSSPRPWSPRGRGIDAPHDRPSERDQLEATRRLLEGRHRQLPEQRRAEQRLNHVLCVMSHEIHGSLRVLMSELGADSNGRRQKLLTPRFETAESMLRLVEESPAALVIELGRRSTGPRPGCARIPARPDPGRLPPAQRKPGRAATIRRAGRISFSSHTPKTNVAATKTSDASMEVARRGRPRAAHRTAANARVAASGRHADDTHAARRP